MCADCSTRPAGRQARTPAISPNETLWNVHGRCQDHSGLIPATLITLAHFAVSSEMSLPKSAGEPPSVVPPRSANCALILGSASAALISLFRFLIVSTGGVFGAPVPPQPLPS